MSVTGTNITLTTRTAKGSALTHAELDANQTGLKDAIEGHSHDEFAAALGTDDNYMTDAEKAKLSGIEAGAEVNVQADWNASTGDAAILNKPSIPSAYTLPTASTTVLGGVKVDGTTILISGGVISSTGGSGGGVTDHGLLTGLSDDDHSQYYNQTRGDARYSQTTHNHSLNNLTEKSYNSLTDKPSIPSVAGLLGETAHNALDHTGLTGVLGIGTTGTTACAGNDSRLSDPRTPTTHSHAQSDVTDLTTAIAAKQATLISGINIKTINGASVLGGGDIAVSGGTDYDEIIVSGSAVTSVTFSGLDGDADGGYVLSISCKQAVDGGLLQVTGNGIATGYYHRQLLSSNGSAAVGVHDSVAPYCAYTSPNTVTDTVVSFECAQNSFHILYNYAENVSPSYGFVVGQAYPQAQANLTSITLTNTQVGGIDVGSTFRLYPRK